MITAKTLKNNQIVEHCTLTTIRKESAAEKEIYCENWVDNTIVRAEAITLLELIETLEKCRSRMNSRKIRIGFDDREACKGIAKKLMKLSEHTKDTGAQIASIKEIMLNVPFKIELVLIRSQNIISRL